MVPSWFLRFRSMMLWKSTCCAVLRCVFLSIFPPLFSLPSPPIFPPNHSSPSSNTSSMAASLQALQKTLTYFPPVRFAVSYGSGVIPQKGYDYSSNAQVYIFFGFLENNILIYLETNGRFHFCSGQSGELA